MPPKRAARGFAENTQSLKEFDPKKIGEHDRIMFNLRSEDETVFYNFMVFIIQLRCIAALGGLKFTGEKFVYKLCLGDATSYEYPFMIASVCFEGSYKVDILIYKPNVYNVGFCINGGWWLVEDFFYVTKYKFPESYNVLRYDSSYNYGVPLRYSFHIFQNAIVELFNSGDEDSFRLLCVILCETMRSDEILRVVGTSFDKNNNGVWEEVELDGTHTTIILNWNHTSKLWYLYDKGFEWDPLDMYSKLTFEACAESLGLAMKTADKKIGDYVERLQKLSPEELEKTKRRPIQMRGF